ncbi:MAG: ABC transporter ATP-binding protein [Tissierellia bacterium]|nr:ABC transporter ATP-binding protein [Tissierellia bacterium]
MLGKIVSVMGPYYHRYRHLIILDLLCAGLTTVAEILLPMILRYITNLGVQSMSLITWRVIAASSLLFVVVKAVEVGASYFMTSIGHITGASIEQDMRRDIYTHLQTLSSSFYNDTKVGQLMSRITTDLFDITEFSHHCPEEYTIGALKVAVSFILLARIHLPLTLMIYAVLPVMLIASGGFRKRMLEAQRLQRRDIGIINAGIEDSLSGIRVTKSFANEEVEHEKFQRYNDQFLDSKRQFYKAMAGFSAVTRNFDGIMYLMVIIGGGYFMMRGQILPGDMVAYTLFVTTLLATVRRILEFTEIFHKGITGIERFHEIMELRSEIQEPENPKILEEPQGVISFDHVDFKYSEGGKILQDLSFHIRSGEHVALVGPSGAGKTTICNLIPRFFDVTSGAVTVDGVNVKDYSIYSLRKSIGMVQQDVYLFNTTIKENIRYGNPQASDEAVEEAARRANAYEFIRELKDGFDTHVGERGVKLSGGQKQRISIARVFLKDPKILILDEATSALDNESEIIIQQALEELTKDRTTLTIAHRLSTVEGSDRILVLTKDGLVEEGNHQELMELGGLYHQLYTKSSDGRDLEEAFDN